MQQQQQQQQKLIIMHTEMKHIIGNFQFFLAKGTQNTKVFIDQYWPCVSIRVKCGNLGLLN